MNPKILELVGGDDRGGGGRKQGGWWRTSGGESRKVTPEILGFTIVHMDTVHRAGVEK